MMQFDDKYDLDEAEAKALAARWERLQAGFPALRRAGEGEEPLFDVTSAIDGESEP